MFDSQTMQMQGSTATELLSPWFPRGGDYGLFTLEVTAIGGSGTPTLTVTMVQKDSDTAGDGTEFTGLSISRTTAGGVDLPLSNPIMRRPSPRFGVLREA